MNDLVTCHCGGIRPLRWLRSIWAGAMLCAATILSVVPAGLAQITEYTVPTAGAHPHGITAGPDGNLWFTEDSGNKIGRITVTGFFDEFPIPTAGSGPWGIASGPDGNLWFTERLVQGDIGRGKIGRITPDAVITEFPVPTSEGTPEGITAGPDGNLWFVDTWANMVGRITTDGAITEFAIPTANADLSWITAGPDGNLWFTEFNGNKIGRMTPSGSTTEFVASGAPFGITAGPDGNIWFTEWIGGKIGRITPNGVITEFLSGLGAPYGITTGPDGNLWFTERYSNRVWRLTTDGVGTPYSTPTPNSLPRGITSGPDGGVWFAEYQVNKIGTTSPPAPLTIDGISPSSGSGSGGTSISIAGSGFQPGATVSIGAPASNVVVVSDSEITGTTPFRLPGSLTDVVVTNPDSSSATLSHGWFADFLDVDQSDGFHDYVEKVFRNGITAGCGGGNYCRNGSVTRAQMAVFLLKAEHGASFAPPVCAGVFADVVCPGLYSDWIEQLASEGITSGCGGSNYCPDSAVTRQQMSVFLLKTQHGSAYDPPDCLGVFDDVPCTPGLGFSDWIEQLVAEAITAGCSGAPPLYCPDSPVTRGQMAVFLVKTFYVQ